MRWFAIVLVSSACLPVVSPEPGEESCLFVDQAELDFGEVKAGERRDKRISVDNGTGRQLPLRVTPLSAPYSASLPEMREPRGVAFIDVNFHPTDGLLHLAELEIDTGTCVKTIPLRGLGSGLVDVRPLSLDFGAVELGDARELEFTVTNTRRTPVTVEITLEQTPPSFGPAFSTNAPSSSEIPAMGSLTIRVTAAPSQLSFYDGELRITADGSLFRRGLRVAGGGPLAELSRTAIDVPMLEFSSFVERQVTLHNRGTGPFMLRLVDPFVRMESADGQPIQQGEFEVLSSLRDVALVGGQRREFNFRYVPKAYGAHTFRVVFLTNDPLRPELTLAFSATAVSLPPCTLDSPAEVTLTPMTGSVSSGLVTFTNTGSTGCLLDDVRLDPESNSFLRFQVTDGGVEQVSIAPGQSHVLSVKGPGARSGWTAELGFHVLNPNSSRQSVRLRAPP